MMMKLQKKYLAIAVASAVSLGVATVHAADFTANATLQNTLTVVSVLDFDIGTVFASKTGIIDTNGVAAIVIGADGAVSDPTDSADVNMISLTTPTPAQGSVAIAAEFDLILPDTSTITVADFVANAGGSLNTAWAADVPTELVHESANPNVPSLYLMHFTIGDVSGGVRADEASNGAGVFRVTPGFGETEYVFNIGATLTTQPGAVGATEALDYQEGIYSGTFEVTASY